MRRSPELNVASIGFQPETSKWLVGRIGVMTNFDTRKQASDFAESVASVRKESTMKNLQRFLLEARADQDPIGNMIATRKKETASRWKGPLTTEKVIELNGVKVRVPAGFSYNIDSGGPGAYDSLMYRGYEIIAYEPKDDSQEYKGPWAVGPEGEDFIEESVKNLADVKKLIDSREGAEDSDEQQPELTQYNAKWKPALPLIRQALRAVMTVALQSGKVANIPAPQVGPLKVGGWENGSYTTISFPLRVRKDGFLLPDAMKMAALTRTWVPKLTKAGKSVVVQKSSEFKFLGFYVLPTNTGKMEFGVAYMLYGK